MTNREQLEKLNDIEFAEWLCMHNLYCIRCPVNKPHTACAGPWELTKWLREESNESD